MHCGHFLGKKQAAATPTKHYSHWRWGINRSHTNSLSYRRGVLIAESSHIGIVCSGQSRWKECQLVLRWTIVFTRNRDSKQVFRCRSVNERAVLKLRTIPVQWLIKRLFSCRENGRQLMVNLLFKPFQPVFHAVHVYAVMPICSVRAYLSP